MNRLSIIAAFFALVFLGGQSALAQSGYDLFQKGLVKERTEGDLDEAIRLYKQIVEDFKDDRALVAKALVQMGGCYEKLGQTEARKAYERVLREYADQPEAVFAARSRLTDLGRQKGEEGPVLRRVYSGYVGYPGNLSHDGKLATITDWDTGDLAVRDLTSGEVRRVTDKGSWSESNAMADQSIFSPDNKQIAHVWYTHEGEAQLRIISTDGNGQRILYPRDEENKKDGGFLWPIDWSPEGERILCTWHKKGHKNRVMLLSVADGSLRELELPEREDGKPIGVGSSTKFSPDGRHLTLEGRPAKGAGRDIFLLSLEDGSRTPLVEDPADDYLLGWSPDGNHLVFVSDRTRNRGVWVLRVDQGKPVGNPKLVKTQMGNFGRVGMMRDGAYYFTTGSGERRNVFTAGFDPETGKVTTAPKALLPDAKLNRSAADWLSGAGEIAYLQWSDEGGRKIRKIMVHSLKTGATREIIPTPKIKGFNFSSLAVCPTGHWLAVWGYIEDGLKWAVLLIDLETNELTEVKHGNFMNVRWSKDGRWLYFGGFLPDENRSALFRRDMQTGKVTELFEPPSSFHSWTISPDGKQIAYTAWATGEIKVIPVAGGEPRVVAKMQNVAKVQQAGSMVWMVWTPDGRYLVYIHRGQLWRVAVEGGEPEAITISPRIRMSGIRHLRIHPDGQRILFSGQRHPSKYEIWAIENFLPKPEKASGMVVHRVWAVANLSVSCGPSPDGKYLSYVDWETGDLAVHELATGTNRRLTKEGYDKGYALSSVFSRDGKQVAYVWYNKDKFYELRTVGLDGSEPRVPYRNRDARPKPYAWSPDGKYILAAMSRQDRTPQMTLIGVSDGSVRVLKGIWPRQADFSPDGRFIVYDDWNEIHVLATNGSSETTLIDHPAAEQLLGWSPDGEWILFTSDRRGTWDAWAVQISDGKPQGPAELVKLNIGEVFPMGFTRDGSFYYTVWSGNISNVYTASIDVEATKVLTKPVNITQHRAGQNTFAGWSPDGKYLAYLSRPYVGPRAFSTTIVIRNVETVEEREINPKIKLVQATGGRWSPDGRSLIAVGREKGQGICQIDVETGDVTPLVGPGRQEPVCPVWSSDGKAIYYVQRADEPERILVRDLQTAREREVARGATGAPWLGIALSPDGKHLAFFAGEAKQSFVLRTVPVGGGETRELFRVQQPEFTRGAPAWSPDGRQLLVIDSSADQETHTLWRVSAEDEKAQKFNLAMRGLSHVHMHPDGKQIAFSAHSAQSTKSEFWVMENFLPESKAGE